MSSEIGSREELLEFLGSSAYREFQKDGFDYMVYDVPLARGGSLDVLRVDFTNQKAEFQWAYTDEAERVRSEDLASTVHRLLEESQLEDSHEFIEDKEVATDNYGSLSGDYAGEGFEEDMRSFTGLLLDYPIPSGHYDLLSLETC